MKRTDITPQQRLSIGQLLFNGLAYGGVTKLAKQHKVSRWFIYQCGLVFTLCIHHYECIIYTLAPSNESVFKPFCPLHKVLVLYLHHQATLSSIADTFKAFFNQAISIGKISSIINFIGSLLPTSDIIDDKDTKLIIICDEIYTGLNQPILVVMCPQTGYILSMTLANSRDHLSWGYVYLEMTDNDTGKIIRVSCDLGTGMQKAIADLIGQHLFRYDLMHYLQPLIKSYGRLRNRVQKAWKQLLTLETKVADYLQSTEYQLAYRLREDQEGKHKWEQAQAKLHKWEQKIAAQYQHLETLCQLEEEVAELIQAIRDCLSIADQDGCLRTKAEVQAQMEVLLAYGLLLADPQIRKACKSLKRNLASAIGYFEEVQQADEQISKEITDDFLKNVLVYVYQLERKIRATKKYAYKKALQQAYEGWINDLVAAIGQQAFDRLYQCVKQALRTVIRSSSLVENINGRIRRFDLAARGQLNQNRLNLIRFYLNHKVLERSEHRDRKGYSAYQLFKDKKADTRDWWTILSEDYLQPRLKEQASKVA